MKYTGYIAHVVAGTYRNPELVEAIKQLLQERLFKDASVAWDFCTEDQICLRIEDPPCWAFIRPSFKGLGVITFKGIEENINADALRLIIYKWMSKGMTTPTVMKRFAERMDQLIQSDTTDSV